MLQKAIRKIWRLLSPDTRARLVRATQSSFTVSAAAVISNDKGEVLLLNHVLRPYSAWGLPGGFLDKGEQAEEAIRREIREETGLELEQLQLYSMRTTNSHIEVLFFARSNGDPRINSREIIDLGWFTPDKMPEQMSRVQREQVLDVLAACVEHKTEPV